MEESVWSFEIQEESATRRVILGQVAWSEVKKRLDETLKELGKQVSLKGFRRGHVPVGLLRRMFGKQVREELSRQLTREAVAEAIKRHALRVVTGPDEWEIVVESWENEQPLKFTAKLEVLPDLEPKDYEGVELEAEPIEVSDAEVDSYLQSLRRRLATYKPVEEDMVLRPGRVLECDIMGRAGDEPFDLSGIRVQPEYPEAHLLEECPVPGLAVALLDQDLSEGEIDLEWTVQDGDGPEVPYRALLTVKQLLELELPELSDDLAKESGLADTLEELREKVREQIRQEKEKQRREKLRELLMDVLRERNPVDLPEAVVRAEADRFRQVLQYFAPMEGLDEDVASSLNKAAQEFGERQVHDMLILDAIAKKEGVEVTDEDIEEHIRKEAEKRNKNPLRLKAEYEKKGEIEVLRHRLKVEKTVDLLLSKARVKEKKAQDEAAPEGGQPEAETAAGSDESGRGPSSEAGQSTPADQTLTERQAASVKSEGTEGQEPPSGETSAGSSEQETEAARAED